jgi:hypothetical protein
MPRFRRVSSGQRIAPSAREWNAMIAAAEAHLDATQNQATPAGVAIPRGPRIRVRNSTAADLAQWSAVKLGDPIVTPSANLGEFTDSPTLEASTPDANSRGRWAILAESIPASRYGWAYLSGYVAAQIRVLDTSHGYVDAIPATGSTVYLATDDTGSARIIWAEPGTGTRWALLLLGSPAPSGAIIALTPIAGIGAAFVVSGLRRCPWADCTVYRINTLSNNELTATTQTARVYNISKTAITGSVFIQAKQIGGLYVADFEECP